MKLKQTFSNPIAFMQFTFFKSSFKNLIKTQTKKKTYIFKKKKSMKKISFILGAVK